MNWMTYPAHYYDRLRTLWKKTLMDRWQKFERISGGEKVWNPFRRDQNDEARDNTFSKGSPLSLGTNQMNTRSSKNTQKMEKWELRILKRGTMIGRHRDCSMEPSYSTLYTRVRYDPLSVE